MNEPKIVIKEVSGRKLGQFIKLPFEIYKDYKVWVPPLISERRQFLDQGKNPFFRHADVKYFVAYADGTPVGRIASIVNHNHNQFHNERAAFFGLFESVNDYITAYGLLDRAAAHAKEAGMRILRGPVNFSTNDDLGCLIEGFHLPPAVMMPYNPQYYPELFARFGLRKAKDLYAYFLDVRKGFSPRVERIAEQIKKRNSLTIRPLNMKRFYEDVALVKFLYNGAWEKNWGFVPMTDEEIDHMAKNLKQVVDPDLVLFAFCAGKPAGFSLALPNVNEILMKLNGRLFPTGIFKLLYYSYIKKIIKGVRVITMGILPEYQKRGIDSVLNAEAFRIGISKGYEWSELSWVLEDNTMMNRVADLLGAKVYKKYRIYETEI